MSQLNTNGVLVDYDERTGRFLISSPPWMVNDMRAIPNRRWDSKRKLWSAPGIRANVKHLEQYVRGRNDITVTVNASRRMLEVMTNAQNLIKREPFPPTFKFATKPREYQRRALDKLYALTGAGLFMDKGTGKSKVILDLLGAWSLHKGLDRALIICPLTIRRNWVEQIDEHWAGRGDVDVMLLDTGKKRAFDEWNGTQKAVKLLIVGIESLSAGKASDYAKQFLGASIKAACVVDESTFIKTHNAICSKAAVSLGRMAEWRIAGTGTPTTKTIMDLFMQFEFIDPEILGIGDHYSFRARYAVMGGYSNKEIMGYQNLDELMETIAPFVFQVHKKDALPELPPKVYHKRHVQMTPEQRRLYTMLRKSKWNVLTEDRAKGHTVKNALERMLRLREITGGFVSWDDPNAIGIVGARKTYREPIPGGNPKVDEVIALYREFGEVPTIVWAEFREEIEVLAQRLRHEFGPDSVVEMHGGIDEEGRVAARHAFMQGRARFFLGNPKTGGIGLTLTVAELVIYFSNTEVFFHRDQSEDRAHRIGTKHTVNYVDVMCENTVDEIIHASLLEKLNLADYVKAHIDRVTELVG